MLMATYPNIVKVIITIPLNKTISIKLIIQMYSPTTSIKITGNFFFIYRSSNNGSSKYQGYNGNNQNGQNMLNNSHQQNNSNNYTLINLNNFYTR
jgi:hypothetical protein